MADASDTANVFGAERAAAAKLIDEAAKGGPGAKDTVDSLASNALDVEKGVLHGNNTLIPDAIKTAKEYSAGLADNLAAIAANRRASGETDKSTDTDPANKVYGADVAAAVKALSGDKGAQGLAEAAAGELTRDKDGKATPAGNHQIVEGLSKVVADERDTLTAAAQDAVKKGLKDPTAVAPTDVDADKVFGKNAVAAVHTIDDAAKGGAGAKDTITPLAANAQDVENGALRGNGMAGADAIKTAREYNNGLADNLAAIEANRRASGAIDKSTAADAAEKVFGPDVKNAVEALAGAGGLKGLEVVATGELTRDKDGKPSRDGLAEIAQGLAAVKAGEITTLTHAALKAQSEGFKDPDPASPAPGAVPAKPISFEPHEGPPAAPLPSPGGKQGAAIQI